MTRVSDCPKRSSELQQANLNLIMFRHLTESALSLCKLKPVGDTAQSPYQFCLHHNVFLQDKQHKCVSSLNICPFLWLYDLSGSNAENHGEQSETSTTPETKQACMDTKLAAQEGALKLLAAQQAFVGVSSSPPLSLSLSLSSVHSSL